MPRVLANGIQVHYQQVGQGPDVVLVHGVSGDLSIWYTGVMPRLAGEFRITAYDLRGHGYSEVTPSGYTTAHMAADLVGLLDSLRIERAHLVGHSFGAAVALHCALLHPERVTSLVLADPGIPALTEFLDLKKWPYFQQAVFKAREFGLEIPEDKWFDPEYIARQWLAAGSPVPFGLRPGIKRRNQRLVRLVEATTALADSMEVAGLTLERLSEIRQPILAIYGEASRLLQTAPYLQEKMPNCRVEVVEGAAHFFALARPEVLASHVRAFLHALAAAGPTGTGLEPERAAFHDS